jgi:hypothetical protein
MWTFAFPPHEIIYIFKIPVSLVLGTEHKAAHAVGAHSATELTSPALWIVYLKIIIIIRSHFVG